MSLMRGYSTYKLIAYASFYKFIFLQTKILLMNKGPLQIRFLKSMKEIWF